MLIEDQFGIIQNLQTSPIPQTRFLPWIFFAVSYSKRTLIVIGLTNLPQSWEAIAPRPKVPTALRWCRCLVVGRLEGSRTEKKGKGNLNNRLGLWKQQLAVSISVSSMHRVVFMHTACSLNTSAAAVEAAATTMCATAAVKATAETFPLIFSRGAKDAITGELEEGYREKREMAIKPDSSSRSTTYRTMRSKYL
jgi:hypothetical protein